ncbi:hypothetical protein EXW96_22715 [Paenibacillus sp. JMULE4]|uniref:hypothetical protein n=1 Tax=Paenibacillus sp. JMULE4 TaxID=2518342 RepID=UPI001C2DDFD7|nr:hypothetical protein [Paenibacillus sp. JMULE4]NTZ20255.1 hypothetical protein [Paenibacillus sp. JMULE4]
MLIATFLVFSFDAKLTIKKIIFSILAAMIALFSMYILFMGVNTGSIIELIKLPFIRIFNQSSATYVQINYVRQEGFLSINGIYMPLISSLLGIQYFDISQWAYKIIYAGYADLGAVGTSGGMSLTELYFAFSWFGVPLFIGFVMMYGLVDSVMLNTIKFNTGKAKLINTAFYIAVSSFYSLALVGSVFTFFTFPTILNPSLFFICMLYIYLINVTKIKIYIKR